MHRQKLLNELPEELKTNANVLHWRVSRLEDKLDSLQPAPIEWKSLIGYGLLLILGLSGHLSPEQVRFIALKMLGFG